MKVRLSETELKKKLKGLTIIVDTREQKNEHVTGYFEKNGIPFVSRKLDQGDYSAMLDGMSIEDEIVIEKKNSWNEIAGNIAAERQRIEAEFNRYKANGIKPFLLIENASWESLFLHDYVSKISPASVFGTLMAWQVRYNITIQFCKPENTGKVIFGILYYWMRERL